jgi:hypothetical protein
MASTETKSTPTTREALEQTLDIAEKLIQEGKIEDGLSLVRRVNDVTEEALKNQALIAKVQTA